MLRRDFITKATQSLALLASGRALATPERSLAYKEGLARHPWLLGFKGVSQEHLQADAVITGRLPAQLSGTLYRNGPAQHQVGDYRYSHWFDGDGMVQAFRIGNGQVKHQGRMVATRKYQAEQAAGRALYPGFASQPPNPKPVTSPDLVNVANISVLPHHGKLYALWEAGSPWELNPDTLETIGIAEFSPDTSGVPFSAHPRIEPDGTLWNFGYLSSAGVIVLWHMNPQGKVVKADTIKVDPMTMPHDFVVTRNHLILLLPPLNYQAGNADNFLDAHVWQPTQATRVLVIEKNDFSAVRQFELPAQWVFHFGNAWEDNSGIIRFDGASADSPMAMLDGFRDVMQGQAPDPVPSQHLRYRIDLNTGRASQRPMLAMGTDSEFPTIDPRVSTQRNRYLTLLTAKGSGTATHGLLDSVSRWDDKTEQLTTYQYPEHQIPEEHLFVPHPGKTGEDDGWLVGTALDFKTEATLLNVFDPKSLAAGPIASATLPYALPLGFHGKFAS